jgi:pilus assembly protein CpaE
VSQSIRVIVVNTDSEVANDLRAVLLAIEGVKIVAEIDEPGLLAQAVNQFPAEVVLIHLDPSPAAIMDIVAPIIEAKKEGLAVIAMTEDRDAELVMRAMRAGMREFLWKPFPPDQLREILQRVAVDAGSSGRNLGKLISVVGTGGGLGTTQIAVNVAAELAQLDTWENQPTAGIKPRVAVVDLDFRFGQVAMQLDAQPTYTIADLCESVEHLDTQLIEKAMVRHESGAHVLARPSDMHSSEQITAGQCASALAALQEHYDFVVVDLPARFDPTSRAVFDMADLYLLVVQLMVPAVRAADRVLNELITTGYAMGRVKVVCNRWGREAGYLEQSDVETTLKRKLDFLVPEDWRTSATAINMGAPLCIQAPKSKLRLAYKQLAQALAGEGSAAAAPAPLSPAIETANKKGLFSFLAGAKA